MIRLPVYVSKQDQSLTGLKESRWYDSGGTLYASFHPTEDMIGGASWLPRTSVTDRAGVHACRFICALW